jgi:hypothetical protein
MIIKEKFTLLEGKPNILDISKSAIESLILEGNTPQHVYAALELKKNVIKHSGLKKILEYVKNVKTSKDLKIIVYEQYPIVVSYNRKTNDKIININTFNAKDLGRVSYANLYGALVYAYTFEKIVNKKLRLPDNMAQPISNFFFSLFVQVFGRDYGLVGTYSSKLSGLKFLLTAYILIAFFGRKQERPTFNLAKQYSGFDYSSKADVLKRNDLTDIKGLVKSLSEMEIMPGLNIIKFTTILWRRFDVQMLPMFEDLSRFMSLLMASSVAHQTFSKNFIRKYQSEVYDRLRTYMEKKIF